MNKHTPGPWIACEHGDYSDYDGNCIVILGEGGDIRTAVVLGFDNDENRANARLIASAPDLLALLVELIDIEGPQPGTSAWAEKARAAIAKATGSASCSEN